ncbi:DUF2000 family protein [Micromonospora sp. KC606]|nr:DUF2000 family protein [Micromonospora sp. KC606]
MPGLLLTGGAAFDAEPPPGVVQGPSPRSGDRRGVPATIYTEVLFATNNDEDNRAAVRGVEADKLGLVGIAMRGDRREVDKIVKGASLHP